MDVPDLVGKKFTNFDGISVDGKRFLFVANTSDGSRSIFSGLENVGKISKKRELWNGMNVGGKILETFEFGRKSLGSVVVAGQYDDGSSGVVAAEFSFLAVPAISHIGMIILVLVAIVAVTISVRHESA
jgi:hypothetical protein